MSIRGGLMAQAKARKASVHAVVTRADGTVENLGLISYYHRFAPWRWIVNIWIAVRRRFTG
jgi:hypothetical protein